MNITLIACVLICIIIMFTIFHDIITGGFEVFALCIAVSIFSMMLVGTIFENSFKDEIKCKGYTILKSDDLFRN